MKIARKAALIGVICATLVLSGCSFASFIAAAEADLPPAVSAVTSLTNIIAPAIGGAIQASAALALTTMNLLCGSPAAGASKCDPTSLIGQYQAAASCVPTATTPCPSTGTLLQKIQVALATVSGHLNDILTAARILNPLTQAIVSAAVALVIELVNTVASFIPVTMTAKAVAKSAAAMANAMSAKDFRSRWNSIVSAQYPQAKI
jgi:hypothetical protein